MLDGNDTGTFYAIRLLRDTVSEGRKPIIIWAGAGVSKWCGFPLWNEVALRFHTTYRKSELNYDRLEGQRLLENESYSELFELLRKSNPKIYRRELAATFRSRVPTPVYGRFLDIVRPLQPLYIITTNIDETLEHNLNILNTVQSPDLERCLNFLGDQTPFVAKLHGSASSIDSAVFTTSDYRRVMDDPTYLGTLQSLLAQATVVFIGYSLRDKYILDLFIANCQTRPFFGDGPHFLVQSGDAPQLPESIKIIRYVPQPYVDHRSSITVLDIIRATKQGGSGWFAPVDRQPVAQPGFDSGYFITDIMPPGTWTSSQSLTLAREGGPTPNAIVGQGFDDSELPQRVSPAMHDLMVGLVSFDHVHLPLSCVGRLHTLVGSEIFWNLVTAGVFRFVNFEMEPLMMFRSTDAVDAGDIGVFRVGNKDGAPFTIQQKIRRQIQPAVGREADAERMFEMLATKVIPFDQERFNIPDLTRAALLHPSIRQVLGISDAVFPNSVPRWLMFPVIRFAHIIMAGCACENFALPAAKIGFGSEILVAAAFAVSGARAWADSVSSYVLTSRFNSDLGAYVGATPAVWPAVLAFRESQAGANLRIEILQQVATNAGAEFVASVNAGLRQIIPTEVMDNARDQITELLLRNNAQSPIVPAVWTSFKNSEANVRLWRARSKRELQAHCNSFGIRPKDLCPCNSGETLRDCCARALDAR